MQLISIKSIPIEYQINMERPRLEMRQAQNPEARIDQAPAALKLHSTSTRVRLDTTEMRASMNLRDMGRVISDAAQKGLAAAQQATADLSRFGTQVGRIDQGVTISQLVAQRVMQQPDTVTAFIPSVGPDISWVPGGVDVQYQAGKLNTDWKVNQNVMDFVPGKFHMVIKQYPRVQIEYLGEPQYVPPSASPSYEETV